MGLHQPDFLSICVSLAACGLIAASDAPETVAQRLLASHNAVRQTVGSPLLVWNEDLARAASAWAARLARTGKFEHAQQSDGENLWAGTKGRFTVEQMVGEWSAEKRHFRPGRYPQVSTTGDPDDVGHYTQIIWHKTARVGCAVASNATDDVLVCRYSPTGNVAGEAPLAKTAQPPVLKKRRRGG
jgi:uncharacterized protein YkwD